MVRGAGLSEPVELSSFSIDGFDFFDRPVEKGEPG